MLNKEVTHAGILVPPPASRHYFDLGKAEIRDYVVTGGYYSSGYRLKDYLSDCRHRESKS